MANFFNENISPSVTGEVDAALVSLGQRSCAVSFAAAGIPQGNYAAIQCLTDCTFDELDTVYGTATSSPFWDLVDNSFVFPAGTIFYGAFTVISGSSGTYIAYKA
jgi:hypothetical protein